MNYTNKTNVIECLVGNFGYSTEKAKTVFESEIDKIDDWKSKNIFYVAMMLDDHFHGVN